MGVVLNANDIQTGGVGSFSIDTTYGTTYLREFTSFPSSGFSSGSGGAGRIDATFVIDMSFSTTDTGCLLDQGGGVDGTYIGMVSGGNLRLSASGAVSGVSNQTSTTTTDISAYAGISGELIITIDYQNHIQCWWNDSTNGLNQLVSVDYNGDGDWAGSDGAKAGVGKGSVHGGQSLSAFTGTITRYREFDNNYVDLSSVDSGALNETSSPEIDQTHTFISVNTESTSSITNPDVDELNILDASDVSSATTLTLPNTGQLHNIEATSIESNSEITTTSVNQISTLDANNVETDSEITAPSTSAKVVFLADYIESLAEVTNPELDEDNVLGASDVEANTTITPNPSVSQSHSLAQQSTETNSELTTATILQLHANTAIDIELASEVTSPDLREKQALGQTISPTTTSEVSEDVGLRNLEPIDQDSRFTINIPSENRSVTVASQDYSNTVLVLAENRNVLILADRIAT
tara:strand:- start:1241 stop:2638 length:1398 start_codon:yes stop_codon:yes gene_type:complete